MKSFAFFFVVLLALSAGCRTAPHHERNASAAGPVYVTPSERSIRDRADELQRAGHSKETAERKARTEAGKNAWQYDNAAAWADERARAERSASREKMEKELAKLP